MDTLIYSFKIEETGKNLVQIMLKPGDKYTFGRSPDCDYKIDRRSVSRIQATILAKNNEVVIILDGDGDRLSKNHIYDSQGDPISVHKNINLGDFVFIILEPDYNVQLTFLERYESDTNEITIKQDPNYVRLETHITALENLMKSQIATSKAGNRAIRDSETLIVGKEEDIRTDLEKVKIDVKRLEENVNGLKRSNDAQNKVITFIFVVSCIGLFCFGLAGSFKELSREEKKDVYDLVQNIIIATVGAIGGGTVMQMQKEKN